ncbi:MAG: N-acetyltransferase [Planctomycetes bacterium]|nr:N-acetyltransferase [Planctomycetota bacterium]
MAAGVEILTVADPRHSREFIDLPWKLNAGDPDWVPPLRMAVAKLLDTRHYPFFRHGEAAFFLARRGEEVVGRIAAMDNRLHAGKYNDGRGFFGLFECEDDTEAARALLAEAARWCRGKGRTHLRGPLNYSLNDEAPGVLVDGFNGPPLLLMAHNPRYYGPLLQRAGLSQCKDLYAYLVTRATMADERFQRVMNAVRRRAPALQLRPMRMQSKGFRQDLQTMLDIFNTAWADNWGFIPVTPPEVDAIAADLKPIVRPELTAIAEAEGKPVAMMVCVPNVNELLLQIPDGRLFPTGWSKLLTGLKRIRGFRTMLMGVAPEYRNRGVDALMIDHVIQAGIAGGFTYCELSWVLDDNQAMNSLADKAGGRRYRTYRLFEGSNDALLA